MRSFRLTGDAGSPYEFGIRFSVDGDYFAVMGFWALLGVTCLCAGMVLADVPERIGGRFGHE